MYARTKPKMLPVIKVSKFISNESRLVNILVIPTASIRPGTAYPRDNISFINCDMPKDRTIKLVINVIRHINTVAIIETYKVFDAATIAFDEKIFSIWLDQLINSRTGRKNPTKTGIKQIRKAATL